MVQRMTSEAMPQTLSPRSLQNQRLVYGLFFGAAAETLLQIAADPKHLARASAS